MRGPTRLAGRVLSMEGLGVACARCITLRFQFVEELPCVRAIELPDSDGRYECGFEVPQVDSVLGSFSWNQRLPVRDAAAGATVNGPHRSVALDPGTTDATTKRAVAVRGHHGRGWQRQPNCAAVTRAFVHLSTFAVRWWMVRPGCSRRLTFELSGTLRQDAQGPE
jgi:hypothetical protein